MYNLTMFNTEEELCELTGLSSDNYCRALWEAGFDLDDWDAGFQCEKPLACHDASWLYSQMENYCVGCQHVEYGGMHYYLVYHS